MDQEHACLTVLHDWDEYKPLCKRRLYRNITYNLRVLACIYFPWFLRFSLFNRSYSDYVKKRRRYFDVLSKLDALAGVKAIFGVRDCVLEKYPELLSHPEVRRHIHIGEPPDPNRKRLWIPPLNQPSYTWRYDSKCAKKKVPLLESHDTYPIWHVDNPHLLFDYIEFLYGVIIEGEKIYA